ncbi:hypothetical protein [Xanthomonas nasturtii]|uniref:hypothetical protein n=1 Tax=Xanthomonas nasturtii TaxID=1843581 RepID=UPI00201198B5|nr:hypothetical protein [Xanthomonas nasturtii]MCL1585711.1 hypothetical protein [Xanthomonas nasturtii]WVL54962.1 hypothetical protein M3O59_019125 [Xanthomonas nasturtii]
MKKTQVMFAPSAGMPAFHRTDLMPLLHSATFNRLPSAHRAASFMRTKKAAVRITRFD